MTASGSPTRSPIAKRTYDRPSLIIVDSHIGYGAPHKQDTSGGTWRAAGRRRGQAGQAPLRLARGREIPGARRRLPSISPKNSARAAVKSRTEWAALFEQLPHRLSRSRRRLRADPAARPAGGLGPGHSGVPGRSQGDRQPRFIGACAERDRPPPALADRRGRRSGAVDQDPLDLCRCRRFRGRRSQGPQFALRRPRARDGLDLQRAWRSRNCGLSVRVF